MINDELFIKVVPDRKINGDVHDQKKRGKSTFREN
jgi:hypothetical protein